ncbi:RDD family protein [Thiomicrorhabdus lithotrophica]|uniref:RDD family protein n=1 Tax=Thiomicrorhabdus lithotrophica TaxID=2949997 RepID=A0ABY8C7Y4_9GAMM|nr:RDD family protein [Thiomicrorhabdus lithotrophica]WEJ62069.1 RDD family protein [Thiomicrorhabdus lithotrophica]
MEQIDNTAQTPISYGGFWKRLAAYILDWIILTIISIIILVVFSASFGTLLNAETFEEGNEAALLGLTLGADLLTFAIAWLYYAGMESSSKQATFGKLALGMKVTRLNGEPISFLRASARFFSKILSVLLLFIGFIMIAFTEKKQGLHDMIAGVVIVNK